jgi:hypothetical protein
LKTLAQSDAGKGALALSVNELAKGSVHKDEAKDAARVGDALGTKIDLKVNTGWARISGAVHTVLDIAGFIPGLGAVQLRLLVVRVRGLATLPRTPRTHLRGRHSQQRIVPAARRSERAHDVRRRPPKLEQWLAQRPRFHMHFVPMSSSWLDFVERVFFMPRAMR